jgi:hypothetical protein
MTKARIDVSESACWEMLHDSRKNATLTDGTSRRGGGNMASKAMRRSSAALAIAATMVGIGATGALAQESVDSTITIDGTTGGEVGGVLVLAPGVTISDGDVTNETGIGVVIGGGTSAGSAPGGGTNASAPK